MNSLLLKRDHSDIGGSLASSVMGHQTPRLKSEQFGCLCAKSKCLKLYCACFAKGVYCGEACKCQSCHNLEGDSVSIDF
jgi:hypothetical protein